MAGPCGKEAYYCQRCCLDSLILSLKGSSQRVQRHKPLMAASGMVRYLEYEAWLGLCYISVSPADFTFDFSSLSVCFVYVVRAHTDMLADSCCTGVHILQRHATA
jgi:hypothetical protein